MANYNQNSPKNETTNPVSRKTSEEIDQDELGRLVIGGETDNNVPIGKNKIVPNYETDSLGKKNTDFEGIED